MKERITSDKLTFALTIVLFVLLSIGLTTLYSASYYVSKRILDTPHGFFFRQLIWVVIGFFFLLGSIFIPLKWLRKSLPFLFLFVAFLMIITLVSPLGQTLQGARRWLFVGSVSIQPSELVKVFLVIYLAHFFDKFKNIKKGISYWMIPLIVVLGFLFLTVAQNDYSTTIFLTIVVFLILWVADLPYRYIVISLSLAIPLLALALVAQPYRMARLFAFLDPYADLTGSGYQFVMAKKALQNGGFFGLGLGESLQKMGRLPEAYADYIFAVFGEEFGLLGVWFVIFLFSFFAYLGYKTALKQKDKFSFYLAFGLTTLLFLQFLLNISIVVGLMPPTGIPLPFFSSGGSHLVISLVSYGLLINTSRSLKSSTSIEEEKRRSARSPSFLRKLDNETANI